MGTTSRIGPLACGRRSSSATRHGARGSRPHPKIEPAGIRTTDPRGGDPMSKASDRSGVVVVTGASGGIGRATARLFAARGDTVALLARGDRGLDGARRDIEAVGGTAASYVVDTADAAAVDK